MWNHTRIARVGRRDGLAASIIISFLMMVLALPLIRVLDMQSLIGCPFRVLTGLPCPTCGYTRFYQLVTGGSLGKAIQFQPFLAIIVIFSAAAAGMATVSLWRRCEVKLPKLLLQGIWAVLALSWIWNLCSRI